MIEAKIPEATIYRLSAYLRVLLQFEKRNIETTTSSEIGEATYIPDNQVRKDLAYFGQFGISGTGYNVKELESRISEILGVNNRWDVVLIGVGKLGRALLAYPGFKEENFNFVAALDNDETKIGKPCEGLVIQDAEKLVEVIRENNIKIGIITVPASAAQVVANKLVEAEVECILNFAPVRLRVPSNIKLHNVDLTGELAQFSYFLTNKPFTR